MVFFNYSTMQMAAKVVYYGPGLCGKTTNLQFIYGHTSQESRGEMVSLETETDRTLFFDLLPIDVGSIARLQDPHPALHGPGPGVLQHDPQARAQGRRRGRLRRRLAAPDAAGELESLQNLQSNLEEMNLTAETMPIVLQYNKRDLPDVCSIEEMEQALNPHGWPSFGASAVSGQGVFETLKGISKLTLLNLKKRLSGPGRRPASHGKIIAVAAPTGRRRADRPLRPPSPAGSASPAAGPAGLRLAGLGWRRRDRARTGSARARSASSSDSAGSAGYAGCGGALVLRWRQRLRGPARYRGNRARRRPRRKERAALPGRQVEVEPGRRPRRAREDPAPGHARAAHPATHAPTARPAASPPAAPPGSPAAIPPRPARRIERAPEVPGAERQRARSTVRSS